MIYHDPSPSAETVSDRLRAALALRGTFAHRASEAAGLSRATARWILDHPPRVVDGPKGPRVEGSPALATVEALARALDVDPAWLAWGAPYPAPRSEPVEAPEQLAAEEQTRAAEAVEALPSPAAPSAEGQTPTPEELRPRVSALRARGVSGRALERACGVSHAAFVEALQGKRNRSPATLAKIAAAVDAAELELEAAPSLTLR